MSWGSAVLTLDAKGGEGRNGGGKKREKRERECHGGKRESRKKRGGQGKECKKNGE